ncbi:hypothetical protein [Blastopirellula marina]|uniref:Uncharacterized protein n=1 Tax=Blastopirellula marina DSM 3645 TaxID=314230 RepID=A3ZY83_9BACT|nr:hypothetical protein [Blastopirellula marina]EAQ78559.1 hypothetical protein DSM3645_26789 [Blastopirellula marina DSM 3645]
MLTQIVVWLNQWANGIAGLVLRPVSWTPGWVSTTVIGALAGVAMLIVFKYTSHQSAIKRTRNQIKANLLALSLFKDDLRVGLRAQGSLLLGAGQLLGLSLAPMLVMLIPTCLLLGQLALWYQAKPLAVGEEAIVTLHTAHDPDSVANVQIAAAPFFEVAKGPVRAPADDFVSWQLRGLQPGTHEITFELADQQFTKQFSVGDGYMPISLLRPAWNWSEVLLHPREAPFGAASPVQSIEIVYPDRDSWTSGTDSWLIYWFLISMVAAFAARPFLNVNI